MKLIALAACVALLGSDFATAHEVSAEHMTPIVLAVRKAQQVSLLASKARRPLLNRLIPTGLPMARKRRPR